MTPKTDGKLEQILQAFLAQLQNSIGGQVSELKDSVDKLNDKIDKFNVQLIDERIKNLGKDLDGYGQRLTEFEAKTEKDLRIQNEFRSKSLAYGSIGMIVVSSLITLAVKLIF